jgi:hypothetical protein
MMGLMCAALLSLALPPAGVAAPLQPPVSFHVDGLTGRDGAAAADGATRPARGAPDRPFATIGAAACHAARSVSRGQTAALELHDGVYPALGGQATACLGASGVPMVVRPWREGANATISAGRAIPVSAVRRLPSGMFSVSLRESVGLTEFGSLDPTGCAAPLNKNCTGQRPKLWANFRAR